MKRLSNISESVWNDMRKRSLGTETKIEDDIDILDGQGLFEYLKKHYDYGSLHNLQYFNDLDQICVCLYEDEAGYYTYLFYSDIDTNPELEISSGVHYLPEDLVDALDKRYTITQDEREDAELYTKIEPKGCRYDKLTNRFFLDVLDFILDQLKDPYVKKKSVSESVWNDMRKRSLGDAVKKEDDVDHFGYEEFFVYLTEHYKAKSKNVNEEIGGRTSIVDTDIIEIFIPIESVDGRAMKLIVEMDKKDNSIVSMRTSAILFDKYINLERMLSKNYILYTIKGSYGIYIRSKEKPTNRTVTDLIDTFLAVVDNPILEKV